MEGGGWGVEDFRPRVWSLGFNAWVSGSGVHPGTNVTLADPSAHAEHPREISNVLPDNRRQRRTCYALCHILYPVSAAHTSMFRMDSKSTSYRNTQKATGYRA